MSNIDCPYCFHDYDFSPVSQDASFKEKCPKCRKTFILTAWEPEFSSKKADCLNGGEHDYRHLPDLPPDRVRCSMCEKEIKGEIDKKELEIPRKNP